MNLYIWDGVLTDYTDGIMFAFADSVEEARAMLLDGAGYNTDMINEELEAEPKVYSNEKTTRIIWGGA